MHWIAENLLGLMTAIAAIIAFIFGTGKYIQRIDDRLRRLEDEARALSTAQGDLDRSIDQLKLLVVELRATRPGDRGGKSR